MSNMDKIQAMRLQTGLGIMDLKKALEASGGDEKKALEALRERGVEVAAKRASRTASQGIITSYVHGGRIGAVVELNCETDFVAKTDDFKDLARDLAMQVASMNPENVDALLEQAYIKDSSKTIKDLVTALIAKTGENVKIGKISRIELGVE